MFLFHLGYSTHMISQGEFVKLVSLSTYTGDHDFPASKWLHNKKRINSFKCLTILTSNYICACYVQAGIPALRRRPLHRCLLPKCVEPAQHLALDMSDTDSRCSCTSFLSPCFTYIYICAYIYKSQMIWICCSKVVCHKGLEKQCTQFYMHWFIQVPMTTSEQSKSSSKAKDNFSPAPHKVIGANWFGGAMNIAAATPFQKWTGPLRSIKVWDVRKTYTVYTFEIG